ncbi:MAG: DNA polymerase III subunit epsilon [Bauldia sp.]
MREIIFDTETTGLDPVKGDRLCEIACIELVNHIPTGKSFHRHVNPQRAVPADATRIHGLTDEFLRDKPLFSAVADELLDFVGDATLIAHNASFDMAFVNAELARLGKGPIGDERVIDTLMLARRKHPAGPNSLDALCMRYEIDLSRRTKHSAILDSELLAEVYIELIGGRQTSLVLGGETDVQTIAVAHHVVDVGARPVPRLFAITAAEIEAHRAAVASLGANAIWAKYLPRNQAQASQPTA